MAAGFARDQRRRANELMYTAWHVEAFARQNPLPALKDLLLDIDDYAKSETQDENTMFAVVRALNAAFGGAEEARE